MAMDDRAELGIRLIANAPAQAVTCEHENLRKRSNVARRNTNEPISSSKAFRDRRLEAPSPRNHGLEIEFNRVSVLLGGIITPTRDAIYRRPVKIRIAARFGYRRVFDAAIFGDT
jgi:hypothetical protein